MLYRSSNRLPELSNARGFEVVLTEMRGRAHDYNVSAADINRGAWAFLEKQRLPDVPRFQQYTFNM